MNRRLFLPWCVLSLFVFTLVHDSDAGQKDRPNIIFVLCDDHRWDAMSCMGHPFVETPNMDRIVENGVHCVNAVVTTSLCSPSRASILTGLYTHNHRVVDNYHPVDPSLHFFPQSLRQAGYETAFIGKWHMGDQDDPQRGFDHWVAFRGQGTYYADGHGTSRVVPQTTYDGFNINGEQRVPQKGYITDELTDYALQWLASRTDTSKPYFLYLSHKAVHSDFVARDGERGKYGGKDWKPPKSMNFTDAVARNKPRWLLDQRNSRHGVDYGYNLPEFDVQRYHKRYCEALTAVDDNLGRLLKFLEESEQLENTLLVYMGDNGFQFGEQGLIDKRTAYEASIRVPLLLHWPRGMPEGRQVKQIVANIDIAPTLLEIAGANPSGHMDGQSFLHLANGQSDAWRDAVLYEYYWEWNYPQTPTTLAVISRRYKYIHYHGIWDTDELYDVQRDPDEMTNLIDDPDHADIVARLKAKLFAMLQRSNGMRIPLLPDRGRQFFYRHADRAAPGAFPIRFYQEPAPVTR